MSESIMLKVVTPEGSRLAEAVSAVTAKSEMGEFCVLPSHRPILAALRAGRLIIEKTDGEKSTFVVDRGFFEGGPDHVNVITSGFASVEDLDLSEIEEEISALEGRLADLEEGDSSREEITIGLEWANARLDAKKGSNS